MSYVNKKQLVAYLRNLADQIESADEIRDFAGVSEISKPAFLRPNKELDKIFNKALAEGRK